MKPTPTLWFLFLVAALLAAAPVFAQGPLAPPGAPGPTMKTLQQVEPRSPIAGGIFNYGPGIYQPGSYYLTSNIIITNDNVGGINIYSDNVSLDLCGFTIRGTFVKPNNNSGIQTSGGITNITIQNGRIVGFEYGVISFANQTVIENMTISDTGSRGINIVGTYQPDFVATIRNNLILNTDLALSGVANNPASAILTQGANGFIEGNLISGVRGLPSPSPLDGKGIAVETATHMLVIGNRITQADQGVYINGAGRYRDNVTMSVTNGYFGGTNLGNNQ